MDSVEEIKIQPVTRELAHAFWRAVDVVARERKYLIFTEGPPIEKTMAFVDEIFEKGWSQFYGVKDREVIGWCDILRYESEGFSHSGHLGVGVLPEYRGKGIGRRLMETTIADAFSKGLERIELEVFSSNERAADLYRKLGFVEEGRKRRARFIDGEYADNIVMGLLAKEI